MNTRHDNTPAVIPDLMRLDAIGDELLPMLNALREQEAVVWNPTAQAWMLLRHADVLAALQGKLPLSSQAVTGARLAPLIPLEQQQARIPNIVNRIPQWVVNSDPPEQTRIRTAMMKGFRPDFIEALRPFVRGVVEEVLSCIAHAGTCDLVQAVRDVTVRTIMQFVGIPATDLDTMKQLSDEITANFTRPMFSIETIERTDQAFEQLRRIFVREIAERRKAPREDFLTRLVAVADAGGGITEDELVTQLMLLVPAGHDSTTNTIVFGMVTLIRHPELRPLFSGEPQQLTRNIGELMRCVAMSTAFNRIATADFELHGTQIRRGDAVLLFIASANRDPRVFTDPETLTPERGNELSLVFGNGAHHCLGHLLARMEVSEFIAAALLRFPRMRIVDQQLAYNTAISFRGLERLTVSIAEH
jgi:pimeloyl-[acyl-carrier protein] synthase